MYEIADKYDVPGLKFLSARKFARACKKYHDQEEMVVAAEHALTTTPDSDNGLRKILLEVMASNPEMSENPYLHALLSKHTEFAFDLVQRQAAEIASTRLKIAA
jgi:hypothetical protein